MSVELHDGVTASRDQYRFEALSQQESGRSYFTGKD